MVVRPLRRRRRAKSRLCSTIVCALLAAALPSLAPAAPRAASWSFDWRPNWLPGDAPQARTGDELGLRSQAGLFIAIDPETGRLARPSASQRAAAAAALEQAGLLAPEAPLQIERLPGGGEIAHLHGRFQVFSVARRDASGRFVTDCADDAAAAARTPTTPRRPAREVK